MSTLSWNCRGLGTPWAIQFLTETVFQKKPSIVFLCETLCKKDIVEKVRSLIRFDGAFSVDMEGRSGGLAMFWKNQDEIQLLSYSRHHIEVEVSMKDWSKFRLIGIYGEPDRAKLRETWNLIRSLNTTSVHP